MPQANQRKILIIVNGEVVEIEVEQWNMNISSPLYDAHIMNFPKTLKVELSIDGWVDAKTLSRIQSQLA